MQQWQRVIIEIVGWTYFAAWSVSFYGQIYTNFKCKSVQGMNFDFVALNLSGFIFYSLYNTQGYFISTEETGKVDLNDIFFSYHALVVTLVTLSQVFLYERGRNRIHWYTVALLLLFWGFIIVWSTLLNNTKIISSSRELGVYSFMGYFKIVITALKYLPQLYWNYERKSTVGWSIFNILMDMTGGLFSFLQLALEKIFGQEPEINIVKLTLGVMVVVYDTMFIFQHYVIYRHPKPAKSYQLVDKPETL